MEAIPEECNADILEEDLDQVPRIHCVLMGRNVLKRGSYNQYCLTKYLGPLRSKYDENGIGTVKISEAKKIIN